MKDIKDFRENTRYHFPNWGVEVVLEYDVGKKIYYYNSMSDLLDDFNLDYGFRNYFLMSNKVVIKKGCFIHE